jgi:hypothetical protein
MEAEGCAPAAANRAKDRRHVNQIDLVLVNPSGVLQGPPYHSVPHIPGRSSNSATLGAPYFLKVYGLSRPEVHGHAFTCLRLDIQHD